MSDPNNNYGITQNNPKTQIQIDNQKYISRLDKFFCCFTYNNLARFCCCGCSLKVGVVIICILGFLEVLSMTISLKETYAIIPFSILTFANFIGYLLILISTFNLKVALSYYGYIILIVLFWIKLLLYIAVALVLIIRPIIISRYRLYYYTISYFIIYFVIELAIYYYYIWIIFSYTKFLALGDFNAINGIFPFEEDRKVVVVTGVMPNYQNVNYNVNPNNGQFNNQNPGVDFNNQKDGGRYNNQNVVYLDQKENYRPEQVEIGNKPN